MIAQVYTGGGDCKCTDAGEHGHGKTFDEAGRPIAGVMSRLMPEKEEEGQGQREEGDELRM